MQSRPPTQRPSWYAQGISRLFLQAFWKTLWESWRPRKITYFLWLLAHKGLPVGSWLRQIGQEGLCQICLEAEESPKHCLWSCTRAQEVWRWAFGILTQAAPELGLITWGAVCWCSTAPGYHQMFEADPQDPVFFITQGT